eukprot:TRINITY_DN2802_c0_g2_i5.p1 TRINITY_DN2802_c0_g2~~TRINITY_DN2802_c0_g2_i5.p1  ORF type:complete len:137 (+),score=16.72 TRINITY_DN2802_c0_g2_i5:656-1066(+)
MGNESVVLQLCEWGNGRQPSASQFPMKEVEVDENEFFSPENSEDGIEEGDICTSDADYQSLLLNVNIMTEELSMLKNKIKELEGLSNCTVCRTNFANTMFLPCAHSYACLKCSESISRGTCRLCRNRISKVICFYR